MHRARRDRRMGAARVLLERADDLARPKSVSTRPLRPRSLRADAVDVVRRPTGGRAILHHREITYSVTAPWRRRRPASRTNGSIASPPARSSASACTPLVATPEPRARRRVAPCFDEPAAGELTFEGRKLAGSAQWRADGALLQHGSILIDDDQSRLADFAVGAGEHVPAPATLSERWAARRRWTICRRTGAGAFATSKIRRDTRSISTMKCVPEPRPSSSVM